MAKRIKLTGGGLKVQPLGMDKKLVKKKKGAAKRENATLKTTDPDYINRLDKSLTRKLRDGDWDVTTPAPSKKRRNKQKEVTAQSFVMLAKDIRKSIDKLNEPGSMSECTAGAILALTKVEGAYKREAARLRKAP